MAIKKETVSVSSAEKAIKLLAIAVEEVTEKATDKISAALDLGISKIGIAADLASGKLASDALRATDVVANSAANALKTSNASGSNDHDLLIRLEEGLKTISTNLTEVKTELKLDIKEIKDGTALKIESNRTGLETLNNIVAILKTDVDLLKSTVKPITDNLVVLGKIASNNQQIIKIGGVVIVIIVGAMLYHFFGIKI